MKINWIIFSVSFVSENSNTKQTNKIFIANLSISHNSIEFERFSLIFSLIYY